MARSSGSRKEATHEHIVQTAARALRERGPAGVGVAEVMQEAGLTHGGFYAHFKSKNLLIAEAADRAASESMSHLIKAIAHKAEGSDPLRILLETYLSQRHLHSPERGCLLASLGSDLQRESPEVRRVATERIKELIDLIQRQMPGWQEGAGKARAMATLAGMVGAMIVARAVDEPDLAQALLDTTVESLSESSPQQR